MIRTTLQLFGRKAVKGGMKKKKAALSPALIDQTNKYSAKNYSPLSVVFRKAKGVVVTDVDGKKYFDFLSGYGAVSQGHVHPKIIQAAKKQLSVLTLSSRAFYSEQFANFSKYITKVFGYEKVLPANTGAEGVEGALKVARKWGYLVKKIPQDQAIIVCATENFHGRTFGCISLSDDPDSYGNYGPLLPGIIKIPFGDERALAAVLEAHGPKVCAFICEPIQGEAGIKIPPKGYLKAVRALCTKHNCLYVDDEVQAGCGRTGKMLAVEHEGVRPDIVILAKALGGGVLPVAAILADDHIMSVLTPGTHGSTFGGNPLACAVGIASIEALIKEKMIENSRKMGVKLMEELKKLKAQYPSLIKDVRGRGLFTAIEFDEKLDDGHVAYRYMYCLKKRGILAKTTHGNIIRVTPPLTLTAKQLKVGAQRLKLAMDDLVAELKEGKTAKH